VSPGSDRGRQRNPDNHEIIKALAETFPKKIKRVYELNRAILSYSKELSTTLTLDRERVNLKEFLDEIAGEYREQPSLQGIELRVLCADAVWVEIDAQKMRRVFRNLIRNAADACAGQAGAKIVVEVRVDRDSVTVLVTDNGPGVPEKIRDRLFHPFETYGKENGTGLGLAMARRLVVAHGGTLELLETQGGACFEVVI
jgi:signal transduction histidine kinase